MDGVLTSRSVEKGKVIRFEETEAIHPNYLGRYVDLETTIGMQSSMIPDSSTNGFTSWLPSEAEPESCS